MSRTISRLVFFLLVFFSLSASAADTHLWMVPVAPTTSTPITFYYAASCEGLEHISRTGSVITLELSFGPCSPPRVEPLVIPLPEKTLPPGEYRVEVFVGREKLTPSETFRFVVRNDDPREPFRAHPFAVVGGVQVSLVSTGAEPVFCGNTPCRVIVDGLQVTSSRGTSGITFTAPPHAPGLVDVIVQAQQKQHTLKGALYYFDPNAPILPSVFERILFPLLFSTPGAGGSQWRTSVTIANPNPWEVANANAVVPLICLPMPGAPCGERLFPFESQHDEGGDSPHGVALLAPRTEAPSLSFHLNVRDVSQDADNFGSEIPVVRENQMAAGGEVMLLDVPRDPRYRVKVRIYAFDQGGETQSTSARVVIGKPDSAETETRTVVLTRNCSGGACMSTPFYGELDLQTRAPADRVNLTIRAGSDARTLTWAFASVTNNKTQQVSIISANGATTCLLCQ
ncbi:MAG: hypothetical protein M3Q69_10470 [Acidobacteriota bacterium]|nr:hypothetical protein [Acidobacteriota bacterium]